MTLQLSPPDAAPRARLAGVLFWPARLARRLLGRGPGRILRRLLLGLATGVVLYFGVGSFVGHRIDDDPDFAAAAKVEGGSHAIDMAVALIQREVEENPWSVNDPWFMPDGINDNTANFQSGIMQAVARFSLEMLDGIGRLRASSSADPDLERAAGLLQFPGDVWVLEPGKSFLPTIPSEHQYIAARRALESYNARLAAGDAIFERRTDVLAQTIGRIIADLGSQTANIDQHFQSKSGLFVNTRADDLFYRNKGKLYAYYLLLRETGRDFESVIAGNNVDMLWGQALTSLRLAADKHPLVVLDGAGTQSLFANHLLVQGFYMKRALVQLDEIVRVLTI